ARHSDRERWSSTFAPRDVQQLHGEINLLRHLPLPVMVRAAEGTSAQELRRVRHAAATVDADVEVSLSCAELAAVAQEALGAGAARVPSLAPSRTRLLGECDPALRRAIADRIEVALFTGEVVADGRVELLPFLHEQAISATNHRYGNPLPHPLDLTGGQGWARGRA